MSRKILQEVIAVEAEAEKMSRKELVDLASSAWRLTRNRRKSVDWEELADNGLVSSFLRSQQSRTNNPLCSPVRQLIDTGIARLMDEEIFDSVIPYLLANTDKMSETLEAADRFPEKKGHLQTAPPSKPKHARSNTDLLTDAEVNIHVSDEFKNEKKDFKCSQRVLMTKMKYFTEITSGQKLEEMDISVHCDIEVFEWIINWAKKDHVDISDYPVPEASKVVAILVSSEFLQIEPLIEYCLSFIKNNINRVISSTPNMSCISECLVGRLADLFSNIELEDIIDERDKILSRLFCKFILFLSKPVPDLSKCHYSSLAFLYRCHRCQKYIHCVHETSIPCLPKYSQLDYTGNIISFHEPDQGWSLNKHVYKLKQELKNWRKIYWRLWGDCHFQFCIICNNFYAVSQTNWCLFHKENPKFFKIQDRQIPIGRFRCCGEKTYRFEVLLHSTGCQYKPHVNFNMGEKDQMVNKIIGVLKSIIFYEPSLLKVQEKFVKLISHGNPVVGTSSGENVDDFWWKGLEITPKKNIPLLLKFDPQKEMKYYEMKEIESPVHKSVCQRYVNYNSEIHDDSCVNDDHTDESPVRLNKYCRRRSQHKCMLSPHNSKSWNPCLSNRDNQDNLRCNEERTMQIYCDYLIKKGLEHENYRTPHHSDGGVYVQIEEEWRQKHGIRGGGIIGPAVPFGCPGNIIVPLKGGKGAVTYSGSGLHSSYRGAKGRAVPSKGRTHMRNNH